MEFEIIEFIEPIHGLYLNGVGVCAVGEYIED